MKHLGDITKIKNPPFVDVIFGGSPCQDLSVAGKRAGFKHVSHGDSEEESTRSGLFYEQVRIIKEMYDASNGLYPTFAVWENVGGATSSNNGDDFRCVLEEFARCVEPGVHIPRPDKKWPKAGTICGDAWSIAWRFFDAQYWGVPQRRGRYAVVLDLRGQRAAEVLFECQGVSGYLDEGIEPWQGIARNPEESTGTAGNAADSPVTLKIRGGVDVDSDGIDQQAGKNGAKIDVLESKSFMDMLMGK